MKNAYSFYFHIRQITELETFKIWIGKEIFVSRLKNQLLHAWSETVLFSIKASRQKSYEECILILLPYSPDYGTWDLQNLKKERDSRKSLWKSKKLWRMHNSFYFNIRQITELVTFKIWIGKEIFVIR